MIIGIAGTAKNTGKTTTLAAIMGGLKNDGTLAVGLTSIGYDGESFDNVTGLPKPQIDVWPGNIVATASQCVDQPYGKVTGAKLEIIKKTDIFTPLGMIIIYHVTQAGKVVLAGANKRSELRSVLDMLRDLTDIIIVDGALNRIVPMAEANCLILATGAARHRDIPQLAAESRCIVDILSAPVLQEHGNVQTSGAVLNEAGFNALQEKLFAADTVLVNGVITGQYLKKLASFKYPVNGITANGSLNKHLIFENPMQLLLAGEIVQVRQDLQQLTSGTIKTGVKKACKLLAMTVNPYYPKYRYNRGDYEAAYVDGDELLASVGSHVKIPCFDIMRHGGQAVFNIIKEAYYELRRC